MPLCSLSLFVPSLHCAVCDILVPQPGIEPEPSAVRTGLPGKSQLCTFISERDPEQPLIQTSHQKRGKEDKIFSESTLCARHC